MDKVQYDLQDLRKCAAECKEKGIGADVDQGLVYAFVKNTAGMTLVADGRRLWRNPQLVQEIDILGPDVVTSYFYLKNVNMVPTAAATKAGKRAVSPEMLPQLLPVCEVVVFDHTRGSTRPIREVIQGPAAALDRRGEE